MLLIYIAVIILTGLSVSNKNNR